MSSSPEMQHQAEPARSRRVLVTWGSKRGGTAGIGQMLAEGLREHEIDAVAAPADAVKRLDGFDAVIVGGALYANRWPATVRRFVRRNVEPLRKVPVWFFSSGPLDNSADREELPVPTQIAVLGERVGAKGHVTFGGRLERNAKGFPASSMAKTHGGDFRNPARIRAWADELAAELPNAKPGAPVSHAARSLPRLLAYGLTGALLCVAGMTALLQVARPSLALGLHVLLAACIFGAIAASYFTARGAREPLPTALTWTALVALLEVALVAVVFRQRLALFENVAAWLGFTLIFLVVWATGALISTMPWAKPNQRSAART